MCSRFRSCTLFGWKSEVRSQCMSHFMKILVTQFVRIDMRLSHCMHVNSFAFLYCENHV